MIFCVFLHSNTLHVRSLLVSNSLNIYYIKNRIPPTICKDTTMMHSQRDKTNERKVLFPSLPTTHYHLLPPR